MDHSHMDHSSMDMGHAMPARCSMNMLFTWNTQNLCIVFRWWHIQTTAGLIFSLIGVVALAAFYEAIRAGSRKYEKWAAKRTEEVPRRNQAEITKRTHVIKALMYAIQNFYAFMLMLVFMTYNGWVMIAIGVGSFVGYLVFGADTSATKDTACH
ncbi:ctr copper transporter [Bisporella sp. PMI_857]|nr:ctr copper transporter [Bisporella sp. PMI_857]